MRSARGGIDQAEYEEKRKLIGPWKPPRRIAVNFAKPSELLCRSARPKRIAVMAKYKRRKFSNRDKTTPPTSENKQADPAPIRARAPLIEQYYVAVDRQLKSGFGTYEAAEKAAQEIKKRYPSLQVTVFDAKKRSFIAIEQPIASTAKRRG